MNSIVRSEFGSIVYGTRVETSDTDIKGVFLPNAGDILLQVKKETIRNNTKTDNNSKNLSDDIDEEYWSLKKYIELLLEGNTPAIDLLFIPEKHYVDEPSYIWKQIQQNRHQFLSKESSKFVGYCMTQASKYGIKGSRIAALRIAIDFLNQCNDSDKLITNYVLRKMYDLVYKNPNNIFDGKNHEFIDIVTIQNPAGKPEHHFEVLNRKIPLHCTVRYAKECFQRILDQYGQRALLAEKNEALDWKSLMHAVRVASEAIELLTTGNITFPRPEKELLLRIRKGLLPYPEVANLIEEGLIKVKEAQAISKLPEKPNFEFANSMILQAYKDVVFHEYRS